MPPEKYDPHDVIGAVQTIAAPEPVYMLLEAYDRDTDGPSDELLARLGIKRQSLVVCLEEYDRWKAGGRKFMPDVIAPWR
jgi:hypothetical protein